jgi:hypothetical protein
MTENRPDRKDEPHALVRVNGATVLSAETLRNASPPYLPAEPPKGEERVSVFWRIFGGTLLSIAALVVITVYQQFTNGLRDLRSEVNRLTETRAELVKKDEFNTRNTSLWNSIKELQTANAAVTALKERAELRDQQLKAEAEARKELARELQLLRERLAKLEGQQAAKPATEPAPSRSAPSPRD